MTRGTLVLVSILLLAVGMTPAMGQDPGEEGPGLLKPAPGRGFERGPNLPDPIETPQPVVPTLEGYQLVGFTQPEFTGDKGLLNMTLGCQAMIRGSRICTVTEIMRTVDVPEVPSGLLFRRAWVLSEGAPTALFEPIATPTGGTATLSDCRGWASGSSGELGLALDLGPPDKCYGALIPVSCDQPLAIACCASPESWGH